MDTIRAFKLADFSMDINILGTPTKPLFQANQIGQLLGIKCIRMSIGDFDEDEKVVSTTYTLGGARPFQKWVCKVIDEIHMHGSYVTVILLT